MYFLIILCYVHSLSFIITHSLYEDDDDADASNANNACF